MLVLPRYCGGMSTAFSFDRVDPGVTRRYWFALAVAGAVGLLITFALLGAGVISSVRTDLIVHYYLVTWVLFCAVFLSLSLRHWTRVDVTALSAPPRRWRISWRAWLSGIGSPESWSLQSGVFSAIIVIAASRLTGFQDHLWLPVLGLFTVAGSWGLMVVAFAEQYLRLHLQGEDLDLPEDGDDVRFGNLLNISVAVSTMVGTRSTSRLVRTTVRSHTLVAFAFNTIIVAMTVSLLFT